jgi:hypothetical protein
VRAEILLNRYAMESLIEWNPVSERITITRCKTKITNVTAIHCYTPIEVTEFNIKEEFYLHLNGALEKFPKRETKF